MATTAETPTRHWSVIKVRTVRYHLGVTNPVKPNSIYNVTVLNETWMGYLRYNRGCKRVKVLPLALLMEWFSMEPMSTMLPCLLELETVVVAAFGTWRLLMEPAYIEAVLPLRDLARSGESEVGLLGPEVLRMTALLSFSSSFSSLSMLTDGMSVDVTLVFEPEGPAVVPPPPAALLLAFLAPAAAKRNLAFMEVVAPLACFAFISILS